MSDDRQEMITQFRDVTGETAERAEFYLSSANWTLQVIRLCFAKIVLCIFYIFVFYDSSVCQIKNCEIISTRTLPFK